MTNTKIIATLGPATSSQEMIEELIMAGVDVFRLNASHGSVEERAEMAGRIRNASKAMGTNTAILLDLQGPKIRLGRFDGGEAVLVEGAEFVITTENVTGSDKIAATTYGSFARDVKAGDRVLLADGSMELEVLDADGVSARCRVKRGGVIKDRKGINLPGATLSRRLVSP